MPTFEQELKELINKHSMENGSNTPDYILASYMLNCLLNFNEATINREAWNGRVLTPVSGGSVQPPSVQTI